MKSILSTLTFLFFFYSATAQKPFSVKIQFPPNINLNNVRIGYENGQERKAVEPKFVNNKLTISGVYYSKYVTLWIYDDLKDNFVNWNYFWIEGPSASISFVIPDSSQNIFRKKILNNAHDLRAVGERHHNFIRTEYKAYKDFSEKYFSENFKGKYTDSLANVFNIFLKNLNDKDIAFVRKNGNQYYAFDYFRRNLALQTEINADTLVSIFDTAFPTSFKESFEGKELIKFLKGKTLKKNSQAPIIKSIEHFSKNELSLLKDKATLLVFWASWCKPCIAEIPAIKEFRRLHQPNKLNITYVTLDEDSTKFLEAVKKYELDWNHIYGDSNFIKTFGVLGIPQVFLIDKTEKILYSREEEKDYDAKLPILGKLLERLL